VFPYLCYHILPFLDTQTSLDVEKVGVKGLEKVATCREKGWQSSKVGYFSINDWKKNAESFIKIRRADQPR
jgi:hypothetical protein